MECLSYCPLIWSLTYLEEGRLVLLAFRKGVFEKRQVPIEIISAPCRRGGKKMDAEVCTRGMTARKRPPPGQIFPIRICMGIVAAFFRAVTISAREFQ